MKLLLDTQSLIWFAGDPTKLSVLALTELKNPDNSLTASVASFWEMAIKISIGKLDLSMSISEFMHLIEHAYGISIEPINRPHLELLSKFPLHHKDPFDRMIVAQAKTGSFHLVSNDAILSLYGISRIW